MKYIGINCFPNYEISKILKDKLNDKYNHHNQFRIVCKARGVKHANELTSWVAYNPFRYNYCSETGNKKELSFFENNSKVNFIMCGTFDRYITDLELKELLQSHSTEKGGVVE